MKSSPVPNAALSSAPAVLCLALALAGLVFCGCQAREDSPPPTSSGSSGPRAVSPAAPAGTPEPGQRSLQAALDRIVERVPQPEPARRPLVISQPATNQTEWTRLALERGYRQSGHTNSLWDAQASAAFAAYAAYSHGATAPFFGQMSNALCAARAAGCDDPMLKYMEVRYDLAKGPRDDTAYAIGLVRAHDAMLDSRHHPAFKCLVALRAIGAARTAERRCEVRPRAAQLTWDLLQPRWYGSDEASLEFARRCVTSTNWGGRVPLVLEITHHSLASYHKVDEAPAYWHRPEVWGDVSASYEKFFQLNPAAVEWRHDYARDAFLCGHYKEFLAQTGLFGSGTNFAFFGGEARFREMLRQARSQ